MCAQVLGASFVVSSAAVICILLLLRYYSVWFTSSPQNILLGGYLGSWLFIFSLTLISNAEMIIFGSEFQAKIPEIIVCFVASTTVCGFLHRVSATTCVILTVVTLFFINRISQRYYSKGTGKVDTNSLRKIEKKKVK